MFSILSIGLSHHICLISSHDYYYIHFHICLYEYFTNIYYRRYLAYYYNGTHKTFRRRPVCLLDVLCIKGLHPTSCDRVIIFSKNNLHGTLRKSLPGWIPTIGCCMTWYSVFFYVILNFITFYKPGLIRTPFPISITIKTFFVRSCSYTWVFKYACGYFQLCI